MRAVSAGFVAAVSRSHRRAVRVSALNADLSVRTTLPVTGGTVTYDADRRRSCTLEVGAADAWIPSGPGDVFYPNALIRVERGILIGNTAEFVTLGTFLVDRPEVTVDASGASVTVQCQDRLKLIAKSAFTSPIRYESGTPLADVIEAIAQDAGMGSTLYALDDAGKTLAADRTFEAGDGRLDAIRQLALDYALDVYVDADGKLTTSLSLTDADVSTPIWTFERGVDAIMLGLTKGFDDERLYNHVLVTGEASDLYPVRAEIRDTNPLSPAYNPVDGSGPIGDRLYTYSSAMIRSNDQAEEVANALLLRVALVEEAIRIPTIVHPAFEVGDAVEIAEPVSETSDVYLLDGVSIPLGKGSMTISTRKLRSLT